MRIDGGSDAPSLEQDRERVEATPRRMGKTAKEWKRRLVA